MKWTAQRAPPPEPSAALSERRQLAHVPRPRGRVRLAHSRQSPESSSVSNEHLGTSLWEKLFVCARSHCSDSGLSMQQNGFRTDKLRAKKQSLNEETARTRRTFHNDRRIFCMHS